MPDHLLRYVDKEKASRIDERFGLRLPDILRNPAFMPDAQIHGMGRGNMKALRRTKILTEKNLQGYLKNSETYALLPENSYAPADIVRTLNALTAQSIADAIAAHAPGVREVFACGGGVFNPVLMAELSGRLAPLGIRIATTDALNLPPQWVEAAAFAWLAACRVCREPGNPHTATGAKQPYILGAWHCA